MSDRWIVIPHWPDYQHYGHRDPIWIKDYRSQLGNPDYLNLSFRLRGLLGNLRLAYADSDGQLPADTRKLSRRCQLRVLSSDLESLSDAGFIRIVASKPLALARSREKRREDKKEPASRNDKKSTGSRANAAAYRRPDNSEPDVDRDTALELARRLAGHTTDGQRERGWPTSALASERLHSEAAQADG